VHGVTLGIMVLDTRFQRLPGDIGNAATWPFPVHYAVVRGATGDRVLSPGAGGTLDLFLKAIDDLVALGVDGITTSCGFLAILHPHLVRHSPVPVATSALMQIPLVQATLPFGKRVGVLTADAAALTSAHFAAVGAPADLPVAGLPPNGAFRADLRGGNPAVDPLVQEAELIDMARNLIAMHPDIGAIVLECTNMPPHAAAIEAACGVPVYDIVSLVTWFHAGLRPRRYAP
jgi:hypothetical protein